MRSSRIGVLVGVLVGALVGMPRAAVAEPCENTGLAITMFQSRSTIEPAPDGGLGADVSAHGLSVTWGRCRGLRHRVESIAFEAPDYGDPDSRFKHFARYELQWHDDDWSVYVGVRGITVWAGELRFATPVIGFRAWPGHDVLLAVELESAGVFLAAKDGRPRGLREDLAFEATAAWPATAAMRAELRARFRDYRIDDMRVLRDVTATAGLGLALAARPGVRGVPAFLGIGVRRDEDTEVLVVAELALGVTSY
jgi:hypothetical protein